MFAARDFFFTRPSGAAPINNFGGLWTWGNNTYGQLGIGNTASKYSPVVVGSLTTWTKVVSGNQFSLAIKTDGTLWSWGKNGSGQLGLGNTTNRSSPVQIGALNTWATISVTNYAVFGIKTDGTLWSWGSNTYGLLGLGTTTPNRSSPVQVGALTNWAKLANPSTAFLTGAIKTDGTLWTWGRNDFGQLGLGNITNYYSPKQVGSLTNWASVAPMGISCLATKTDGTLWSWGNGGQARLGLGNTTDYSSPKQVGSLTNWASVAGGNYSGNAIKTNGTLWAWGANYSGNFGNGTYTSANSPVQIGSLTKWATVASTSYPTPVIASQTDNTLWSWGNNTYGQLGLGNQTTYTSPKKIGTLKKWASVSLVKRNAIAVLAQ